MKYLLML